MQSSHRNASAHKTLVLSLQPFRFATRPRKAAQYLVAESEVLFLSPSAIGRAGQWDRAGRRIDGSGVRILQVAAKKAHSQPTVLNMIKNITGIYFPLGLRILRQVVETPADAIFSTSLTLAPLAVAHSWRFKSKLVIDVSERPGRGTIRGSSTSVFAKADSAILKYLKKKDVLFTTVTVDGTNYLRDEWGMKKVQLVRNVPQEKWRARYYPPKVGNSLSLVTIGSIFESRGFEILIDAMTRCKEHDVPVTLSIFGRGRDDYIDSLRKRINERGVDDIVTIHGALEREQVSETYLKYDVGIVAYEPTNASNDSLSNKLMECVSTGRPVIAADLPENRQFVTQYGVGELAEMTVDGIVEAVSRMLKRKDRLELSNHCRALGDSELNWENEFRPVLEYIVQ